MKLKSTGNTIRFTANGKEHDYMGSVKTPLNIGIEIMVVLRSKQSSRRAIETLQLTHKDKAFFGRPKIDLYLLSLGFNAKTITLLLDIVKLEYSRSLSSEMLRGLIQQLRKAKN